MWSVPRLRGRGEQRRTVRRDRVTSGLYSVTTFRHPTEHVSTRAIPYHRPSLTTASQARHAPRLPRIQPANLHPKLEPEER